MNEIITWCNENSGFIEAILALFTLITSIVAIVISIMTARLPFKKRALLSATYFFLPDPQVGLGRICCLDVSVTNCGNRPINIVALNLVVKGRMESWNDAIKLAQPGEDKCAGILPSSAMADVKYPADDLFKGLQPYKDKTIFIYMVDSENKKYVKKFNTVNNFLDIYLSSLR